MAMYPNNEISVSRPSRPRLHLLGAWSRICYKKQRQITYLSPFTSKITMVSDQRLANQGVLVLKKPCSIWMEI
jgi:hypothetical protein